MSRLAGTRDKAVEKREGVRIPSGVSLILAVGMLITLVIVGILILAAAYSYSISKPAAPPETTTTTQSTTTSTTATTSTTTSTTTTSTTTTLRAETTTSTSATTTTTLGKDQVAFCMRNRISDIYINSNMPSTSLKAYLGDYALSFPITDCSLDDNKDTCVETFKGLIAEENLVILPSNRQSTSAGYPTVVLSKDGTGYIVPSYAEMEKLLGCGSLK
jgi:hypothetical protein